MFAPVASYFTVNISSPNTPGLRDLQQGSMFDELLARVVEARARVSRQPAPTPVLIKIAPDLTLSELDDIVGDRAPAPGRRHDRRQHHGAAAGLAARSGAAQEAGGLSGRPLFALATRMLAETYVRVEGAFPLIGAGGIDSGETALAKIRAGACLVQLYSALVFHGLRLLGEHQVAISPTRCAAAAHAGIDELVGVDAAAMTAEALAGVSALVIAPWRAHQPHDQPDRHHDHGAEQEIAP